MPCSNWMTPDNSKCAHVRHHKGTPLVGTNQHVDSTYALVQMKFMNDLFMVNTFQFITAKIFLMTRHFSINLVVSFINRELLLMNSYSCTNACCNVVAQTLSVTNKDPDLCVATFSGSLPSWALFEQRILLISFIALQICERYSFYHIWRSRWHSLYMTLFQ